MINNFDSLMFNIAHVHGRHITGCKPFVGLETFAQESVKLLFFFFYRPLISTTEVTLSPRHEQAKRLLERARFKARSQNPKSETSTCLGQREGL